jgi:lauroyl/myristoyl acyltransferase
MNPLTRTAMGVYYTIFKGFFEIAVHSPRSLDRLAKPLGKIRRHVGYIGPNRSPEIYLKAILEALSDIDSSEAEEILSTFWLNHQRKFLSLFLVPRLTPDNIEDWVEFRGLEHLDEALKAGRGALLPYPHFGDERIHHVAIALRGYKLSVVSSEYADYAAASRAAKLDPVRRIHHVGFRGGSPRWMVDWLKDNGVLQIASTAEAGTKGIWVKVLDRKLYLSSGWIRLAARTGAKVVPSLIQHRPGDRHLLQVYPAFNVDPSVKSLEDMTTTAQRFFGILEPEFRRRPGEIDWMTWLVRCEESDLASTPNLTTGNHHENEPLDLSRYHHPGNSGNPPASVGAEEPVG